MPNLKLGQVSLVFCHVHVRFTKRKFKQWRSTVLPVSTNNHLSPQKPLNTKQTMTYWVGNPVPIMEMKKCSNSIQNQKVGIWPGCHFLPKYTPIQLQIILLLLFWYVLWIIKDVLAPLSLFFHEFQHNYQFLRTIS